MLYADIRVPTSPKLKGALVCDVCKYLPHADVNVAAVKFALWSRTVFSSLVVSGRCG